MKSADNDCRICCIASLSVDILQVMWRTAVAELHAVILNLAKTNSFKEKYLLTSKLVSVLSSILSNLVSYNDARQHTGVSLSQGPLPVNEQSRATLV